MAQQRDGVFTWIHADHLSSATRITNAADLEVRRLAYAAFGEEAENQGSGEEPKYTYTGKEQDSSGLYYYGGRYYDPALSRFTTADTIYDVGPQGLNRYSYALNNPIIYRDPTGHLTYADEQDPQVWEDPRPPEERPITIGENMAEEGEYVDLGDGMKAKKSDVENAPRVYPEGWPELRAAPKKSFLRTNPVSWYAGEVIMFGTNLVASGQWWTDCNLITDECYSEKEIFDVQITVLTDIGLAVGTAKVEKLSQKLFKKSLRAGEVTTYEDFVDRAVVGDNLEGHEIWQHANLKVKGHVTTRLSTEASKKNPVLVLERSLHKVVNKLQRALDVLNQTARQNIEANARILRQQGVARESVNRAVKKAVEHAQKLKEM